ncbi:MAG: S1 RNA-binding domain-containing protein [Clostridia bacterium]|nr:S1 RNA-binding domain-containing protein [Clostridia bacterium]
MPVEVGAIFEGKITGITNFGAFVEFGDNLTGMVHISEVASTYVKEIRDYLTEGQTVKVKVMSVGEDGKISLSIKKAEENHAKENSGRRPNGGKRYSRDNVWQGPKTTAPTEGQSFEDMMARFKQVSDEKMSDLKRSTEARHGGFSRKRSQQ